MATSLQCVLLRRVASIVVVSHSHTSAHRATACLQNMHHLASYIPFCIISVLFIQGRVSADRQIFRSSRPRVPIQLLLLPIPHTVLSSVAQAFSFFPRPVGPDCIPRPHIDNNRLDKRMPTAPHHGSDGGFGFDKQTSMKRQGMRMTRPAAPAEYAPGQSKSPSSEMIEEEALWREEMRCCYGMSDIIDYLRDFERRVSETQNW